MKSAPDDLTGIGDQDKSARLGFFDKVPEPYRLGTVQSCQDDIFLLTGKYALGRINSGAPVEIPDDEVTDRFRTVADNVETFGKIKAFNKVVCNQ